MEQIKEEKPVPQTDEVDLSSVEKKGFNIKVLLFGIPIFIVQLIAVYFITANVLLNKINANHNSASAQNPAEKRDSLKVDAEKPKEFGKFIYNIEDVIINPANTDGKRLLLTSLGFDVSTEQDHQELKAKDVLVKDAIISIMGSKELAQLGSLSYRDTLKTEITNRLARIIPKVKVNTIYFSKFILQ